MTKETLFLQAFLAKSPIKSILRSIHACVYRTTANCINDSSLFICVHSTHPATEIGKKPIRVYQQFHSIYLPSVCLHKACYWPQYFYQLQVCGL
jgi:hypothetical protein